MTGLERASDVGHDLSKIHSVASFFVSRVDTEIDKRLDAIGSDEALALRGKAAIANARLAYALYEEEFSGKQFGALEAKGANRQRPLWASTGVKDPDYSDTMYVTDLVVPNTVNTMPEKTMMAFADHGEVRGDMVSGTKAEAQQVLDDLERVGISYDDVVDVLEKEGVEKFEASWNELVVDVKQELEAAKACSAPEDREQPGGRNHVPAERRMRRADAFVCEATTTSVGCQRDPRAAPNKRGYHIDHGEASQPASRTRRSEAAEDRRALCACDLRRHRRPVYQEADAGGLRPCKPRSAATGFRLGRVRAA